MITYNFSDRYDVCEITKDRIEEIEKQSVKTAFSFTVSSYKQNASAPKQLYLNPRIKLLFCTEKGILRSLVISEALTGFGNPPQAVAFAACNFYRFSQQDSERIYLSARFAIFYRFSQQDSERIYLSARFAIPSLHSLRQSAAGGCFRGMQKAKQVQVAV